MQSGAVWLWRERRGAAPRVRRTRAATVVRGPAPRGGLRPEPGPGGGLAGDGVQIGGGSRAAGPAAEPPPRTKSAKSRPEGGWACGPEFAHCWGLPRNKGKIDYPRRKRI